MQGGRRSEHLPWDTETLRKIVVDLAEQLDRSLAEENKYQSLLHELLQAQRNRKSEQLSKEQLALFEAAWQARSADTESAAGEDGDDLDGDAGAGAQPNETPNQKTRRPASSGAAGPATIQCTRIRQIASCRQEKEHAKRHKDGSSNNPSQVTLHEGPNGAGSDYLAGGCSYYDDRKNQHRAT